MTHRRKENILELYLNFGSFADTNVKTNAIQVLKQYNIDEVVSV